jgi:hypothetical protein
MRRPGILRLLVLVLATAAIGLWSSVPALADASTWKLGYYTPSDQTLSMSNAAPGDGIASLGFTEQDSTALLVTTHGASKGSTLGDLTGETIAATFQISGAIGAFTYWGEGTPDNPCASPASVRFFFETDNGGGFAYTHFWWSNPTSTPLANGTFTLTATVEPSEWSDWDGQMGSTQAAGFADAASNVTLIGLSFGGGCFFENGVGTVDGSGTFTLDSFDVT